MRNVYAFALSEHRLLKLELEISKAAWLDTLFTSWSTKCRWDVDFSGLNDSYS